MAERPQTPLDFKLVFGAVILLTVAFAVGALLLIYVPPPRDTSGLMDTFTTVVKLGMGATCGVAGGRASA